MKFCFFLLCLLAGAAAQAQVTNNPSITFFDSSDRLIPLLIQSAMIHSPQVNSYNADKNEAELDFRLQKKELLRNVFLNSSYNYGNVNNFYGSDAVQPIPIYAGGRSQAMYSVGAGVSINLEQLFGGTRLRQEKQKTKIEKADAELRTYQNQLREQVIALFQRVKLSRTILQHHQAMLQNASLNKTLTDKRFREGSAKIAEQMAVDQVYSDALLTAEKAKAEYQTNIMLLEELVGMPVAPLLNRYSK